MLFIIKKWLGGLLMPLPLLLLLFLFALILLFFTQMQKLAKGLLVISFCLLTLLSTLPIANQVVRPLERVYPPIFNPAQHYDYVLLLGSGGVADPSLAITGQPSQTAISRFIEALRLLQANPNAKLIVSGSGFGDLKSHALMMQELALSVGVSEQRILRLDDTLDTDDEAKQMSEIIRGKRSVLVTSATHMQRSTELFYKYGVAPESAPANFLAKDSATAIPAYYYIPAAHNLNKVTVAWHEYLGRFQQYVKRLIGSWF